MDPVNYTLALLGGGICVCVLVGLVVTRRLVRVRPLPFQLGVWLMAGLLCFGGSQMVGRGLVGWWPFLGRPYVFVRLVRVKISPSSGRMALVVIGGDSGPTYWTSKLFVADEDGEGIVPVCEGGIRDVGWSNDGERLYIFRSGLDEKEGFSKSLWQYVPSARKLSRVRTLPQRTVRVSIGPADRRLLLEMFRGPGEGEKVALVCGEIADEKADRTVCWRKGAQGGHTWGPKSGDIFVATDEESSFGENCGLWVIRGDEGNRADSVAVLEMKGIEEISLNAEETHAALVVRRSPRPCLDFDLYVLDLAEGSPLPVGIGVELGSVVWDGKGRRLAFADGVGLQSYNVSTGRMHVLLEASARQVNPNRQERLKALSYGPSGDVIFLTGLSRVEEYDGRSGRAKVLVHSGRLRRYFREFAKEPAA